jgi:hypothetical protein
VLVEVLQGLAVVGTCYAFDADVLNAAKGSEGLTNLFPLSANRIFAGTPALDDGAYDLRVTTPGGPSNVLVGVLTYELFAEEVKTLGVRQKLSAKWKTLRRMLSTGEPL